MAMMKRYCFVAILGTVLATVSMVMGADGETRNKYTFKGRISEVVLKNYLSRSIHYCGLTAGSPEGECPYFEDSLRVIEKTGAKYISRAAFAWDVPDDDDAHFALARKRAARIHQMDPDIILEADIFETVYSAQAAEAGERDFSTNGVENITVPAFVFREFGREPEDRTFRYEDMVYADGLWRNRWCPGASVPDGSRLETKMWVFYRAKNYIDAGYESIQLGQIQLFTARDSNFDHMAEMIARIRRYGAKHARRGYVLVSGHLSPNGPHNIVRDGEILIDFLPFPLRLKSIPDQPLRVGLEMGYIDSIFDLQIAGRHPSGWHSTELPKLLEFDNYFNSLTETGEIFPWGTDEITWFANQTEQRRNEFLLYAWDWIWKHAPHAFLSMPGRRVTRVPVYDSVAPVTMYYCNKKSPACPIGFNQEGIMARIWSNPNYQDPSQRLIIPLASGETAPGVGIGSFDKAISPAKLKLLFMAYGGGSSAKQKQEALAVLKGDVDDHALGDFEQDASYQREAELLRP